jgi:hypothetical protein
VVELCERQGKKLDKQRKSASHSPAPPPLASTARAEAGNAEAVKSQKPNKKLETLASRPEIARLNIPASELLEILTAQGGSVVLAKKAVLGGGKRAR